MIKISANLADGQLKDIDVLRILSINGKEFYLYTYNETTSKGLIKVYASLNDNNNLKNVSDDEWALIKNSMNQIISNGMVDSISNITNSNVIVTDNRVIALTMDQKNAIEDKSLVLNNPITDTNGISDLGTLDTDAPVSLNSLNNNNTVNNFVDESASSNQDIFNSNNVNNSMPDVPNIPSVDNNQTTINDFTSPNANISSTPSINDFNINNVNNNSTLQDNSNQGLPVMETPIIPNDNMENNVQDNNTQTPFINTDVVTSAQEPVVDISNNPVVNSNTSDEELDKLIEIAKNNLESSKIIYDSLVNYKNSK